MKRVAIYWQLTDALAKQVWFEETPVKQGGWSFFGMQGAEAFGGGGGFGGGRKLCQKYRDGSSGSPVKITGRFDTGPGPVINNNPSFNEIDWSSSTLTCLILLNVDRIRIHMKT